MDKEKELMLEQFKNVLDDFNKEKGEYFKNVLDAYCALVSQEDGSKEKEDYLETFNRLVGYKI